MRLFFFGFVLLMFLILPIQSSFCVYCSGGTPCASDADCSAGCACLHALYQEGVCIPQ